MVVYSRTIMTSEYEEGGRREREREKEGRVGVVRERGSWRKRGGEREISTG